MNTSRKTGYSKHSKSNEKHMYESTGEMPHIKQLNVKRSNMRFKGERFSSRRRSYNCTGKDRNEYANTAMKNIICQFATTETKKRNNKQVTNVQENNHCF